MARLKSEVTHFPMVGFHACKAFHLLGPIALCRTDGHPVSQLSAADPVEMFSINHPASIMLHQIQVIFHDAIEQT